MAVITENEIREMADKWALLVLEAFPKVKAAAKLEKDIKAWLQTHGRNQTVTGKFAIAKFEIADKFADRIIDVAKFFDATADFPAEQIDGCLTVEVKKAEKLLGAEKVNEIASRATVTKKTATLELKKEAGGTPAVQSEAVQSEVGKSEAGKSNE